MSQNTSVIVSWVVDNKTNRYLLKQVVILKELLRIRELSHQKLFQLFSLEKDQTRVGENITKITSMSVNKKGKQGD